MNEPAANIDIVQRELAGTRDLHQRDIAGDRSVGKQYHVARGGVISHRKRRRLGDDDNGSIIGRHGAGRPVAAGSVNTVGAGVDIGGGGVVHHASVVKSNGRGGGGKRSPRRNDQSAAGNDRVAGPCRGGGELKNARAALRKAASKAGKRIRGRDHGTCNN